MNTKRFCQACGAELPEEETPGLCPRCLLQVGLGTQAESGSPDKATSTRHFMPEIGGRFGRYRIVRALGHGGMGVVYEAEEADTGRRVALKVLGQQLDSAEDRARFLREGRLAASINHPNCVYIYGTEEIEGTPTIAMELVAGGTLQERVKQHGPMPVTAAVDALVQIIAGLEAAQAIGILHRDIKPGNCFEDSDGTIKIGDFGLSISTAARAEPNLTAVGKVVGTPAFCSPEQLRGEELNARSDMYSVGVTLFYLLTARLPFEGKNVAQLIANALEKSPPSPRRFRKEMPAGLAAVILRCLRKEPAERFRTYDELRQALAPFTSAAPTPATLGLRCLAGILDHATLGLVGLVVAWLAFGSPLGLLETANRRGSLTWWMLGGSVLGVLYFTVLEGLWGAAVGKAICRLRVTDSEKNPPGLPRAFLRAVCFVVVPALPIWIVSGGDPLAQLRRPLAAQYLTQASFYVLLALLFSSVRRRNGFAAVHDLITRTRVIARVALESRPVLSVTDTPPPNADATPQVGPYHILETLEKTGDVEWLLGYDLRLLRKVWIRIVPPGTPPLAATWRAVGRAGRLRWLTGRRSTEENWDAFEGPSGQPLLRVIGSRPSWKQVRFWLYDLAREIHAAETDATLPPVLGLDRVWITADGRAKLLDCPAPGFTGSLRAAKPATDNPPLLSGSGSREFLAQVAAAALGGGQSSPRGTTAGEVAIPLPVHAREFLRKLPQLSNAGAAAAALKPFLHRVAEVSRLRRAAVVAGCLAFPLFGCLMALFASGLMERWNRSNPELWGLSQLLHVRAGMNLWGGNKPHPTDRQWGIYIASHYRTFITNDTAWSSAFSLAMIQGEGRRFAEQSVTNYPDASPQEIADADKALKPYQSQLSSSNLARQPQILAIVLTSSLIIYVCIPALLAALLCRGGLVLLLAGVTFARKDGARASRLRVFWRGLVAWSPVLLSLAVSVLLKSRQIALAQGVEASVLCGLVIWSLALRERGLPDRLAGTWPVPR